MAGEIVKRKRSQSFFKKLGKKKIGTYISLLIGAVFVLFPIAWIISVSIRPNNLVFEYPASFIPQIFTLSAYEKVFASSRVMRYFVNSYFVGIAVTFISAFLGIMAGYGLSRYNFYGKKGMSMFVVATQTIPKVVLLIPFFIMMVKLQLYNTLHGLIITYASFALPYSILMMEGYIDSIPKELDEAAIIDGASRFKTLWRIIVPIAMPGIIATMIYTFILSWNEFVFVLTLIQNDALRTVPVGIAMLKGETTYEWNMMMAMSVIGSLPVLILYLIGQKYFVSGLSEGSVKG
jgi:multiple sugar transport system permease protein